MENELTTLVSWLISFIGIGVTALLGINILTSLSINRRIKAIVKKEVEDLKIQNKKQKDQLKNYSLAIGKRSVADEYSRMGATINAFYDYLSSLNYSFDAGDKDLVSKNLDDCIRIMNIASFLITKDETTIRNLQAIKNILLKIQDERSYELFSYFVPLSKNGNSQSHQESQSGEEIEEDHIR